MARFNDEMDKRCSICGTRNEIASKRCINCGNYLIDGLDTVTIVINKSNKRKTSIEKPTMVCPTCKARNLKNAKNCWNCGAWLLDTYWKPANANDGYLHQLPKSQRYQGSTKNQDKRLNYWWLIGLIVLFIAFSIGKQIGPPSRHKAINSRSISSSLQLLEHRSEADSTGRYIKGIIKNNSQRDYKQVQISISFMDNAGLELGSVSSVTHNLAGGCLWNFKVAIPHEQASKYKITNINGY